jgi:hypothetical protein
MTKQQIWLRALNRISKAKGPLNTLCWLYPTKGRYASTEIRIKPKSPIKLYLHRLSWEIKNKKQIPRGFEVLHRCDTSNCIRPEHLSVGTHAQNMKGAVRRGRMIRGTKHCLSKLTEDAVREIRSLYKTEKYSQTDLAKKFGVSQVSISKVLLRRHWWWLDEGGFTRTSRRGTNKN